MSSDRLLNALISSITVRKRKMPKISKARTGGVQREFKKAKYKLSNPIRDDIRKSLYEIKNRKNLFSHSKDWKKFESNNKSIALDILYVPHNTEKIRHAYKSKHNKKRKSQVILLMITDGDKWHYLPVKKFVCIA